MNEITEDMIDRFIEFSNQGSYLSHPKVPPYQGTKNGDTEKSWIRRYSKECIRYSMFGDKQ